MPVLHGGGVPLCVLHAMREHVGILGTCHRVHDMHSMHVHSMYMHAVETRLHAQAPPHHAWSAHGLCMVCMTRVHANVCLRQPGLRSTRPTTAWPLVGGGFAGKARGAVCMLWHPALRAPDMHPAVDSGKGAAYALPWHGGHCRLGTAARLYMAREEGGQPLMRTHLLVHHPACPEHLSTHPYTDAGTHVSPPTRETSRVRSAGQSTQAGMPCRRRGRVRCRASSRPGMCTIHSLCSTKVAGLCACPGACMFHRPLCA